MADVRLTAINPEDSSVVPVACNDKGELKLEEPKTSGDIDGDLTVSGSGTFGGALDVTNNGRQLDEATLILNNTNANGYSLNIEHSGTTTFSISTAGTVYVGDNNSPAITLSETGSATFGSGPRIEISNGTLDVKQVASNNDAFRVNNLNAEAGVNPVAAINTDGSVLFAGNKAGFTKEGYLWCTTERGDSVYLQATSNGLGQWAEYTPTRTSLKDKVQIDPNFGVSPETDTGTP